MKFKYLIILFLFSLEFKAQNDTTEIIKTIDLARADFSDDPRKSIALSLKALELATAKDQKKFIAKSYNTIGSAYYYLGLYDSAEFSHQRALEIQREINDVEGLGRSYTNIGSIYSDKGLNDKAISYFLIAEKKFNLCGYSLGQAKLNNSLGILFYNIKDYTNAIKYYKNGLKIASSLSDQTLYYSITINLANVLGDADNLKEAIALYYRAYLAAKEKKDYSSLLVVCNNICQSYLQDFEKDSSKISTLDSARKYDKEALLLLKKFEENTQYKELAYTNHAIILSEDKNFKEAVPFLDTAILIAKEFKDVHKQIGLYNQLALTLKGKKDLDAALEALRQSSNLKDTLYLANLEAKLSELNAVHNVEKKEAEIGTLNAEKRNQKKVNLLLIVIITLVFISLVVMIYNYIQKRKDNRLISTQKKEVESQNKIIEDKQREIIDSITYAKRLQDAILPPDSYIKTYLPDSFVLYQPKDIVAGDFYWMETLTLAGEQLILFAAADCTGHGVPGAMGSVVCSNALNRSILEFKLSEPGEILDKTRELVIATFEKSNTEVKDGMDISFCSFNPKTLELKWAGANNPLWIVRDKAILETKADKQPIGKYALENPFTTHSFKLTKGDQIYLLTDGFADQFGGPKGKKFKYKPLQEKIISIASSNMEEQKQSLLESFMDWKKELQQVDDVCIIGVKV